MIWARNYYNSMEGGERGKFALPGSLFPPRSGRDGWYGGEEGVQYVANKRQSGLLQFSRVVGVGHGRGVLRVRVSGRSENSIP